MHAGTWPFVKRLVFSDGSRSKRSYVAMGVLILNIYALRYYKFWKSVYISSNVVLKTVFSCFANSQDFNQLCYLYGVSVRCMNFSELTCVVYEHFGTSTMWFSFLYHVEVSVVMFVCRSVCLSVFYLCWVLYSVFVTNKRIYKVNQYQTLSAWEQKHYYQCHHYHSSYTKRQHIRTQLTKHTNHMRQIAH